MTFTQGKCLDQFFFLFNQILGLELNLLLWQKVCQKESGACPCKKILEPRVTTSYNTANLKDVE
jgi:hypothetical protein